MCGLPQKAADLPHAGVEGHGGQADAALVGVHGERHDSSWHVYRGEQSSQHTAGGHDLLLTLTRGSHTDGVLVLHGAPDPEWSFLLGRELDLRDRPPVDLMREHDEERLPSLQGNRTNA